MFYYENLVYSNNNKLGNTPLHLALTEGSKECIPLLIEKGADIYLENAKGQSSCALSVVVGEDNESVQEKFFEAINIVDSREFELKRKYKHRTIVGVGYRYQVLSFAEINLVVCCRAKVWLEKKDGRNKILNFVLLARKERRFI